MIKRFRIELMCCASLLAACGDDASHEDTSVDRTGVLAAEATPSSLDAALRDASTASTDAAVDGGVVAPTNDADACDRLTYENTAAPFFATYCATCHRLPQPTFNNLAEVTTFRARIQTRLFASPKAPMPPPGAPLQPPEEAKQKLQQWLRCEPLD